jgi:hypothetical protein
MTTKVEKLRADAEKARRLAEEAEAEAAREAEAEAARVADIKRKFYDNLEDEYNQIPGVISAARAEFFRVALEGDLQATYQAWQAWQKVWSEQAAWAQMLWHELYVWRGDIRGALVAQRNGIGDFSEDLKNALRGALKDEAAAAYISERTADLTKALKG